jgi:hypothetical protein
VSQKTAIALLGLALAGCAMPARPGLAASDLPAGYPVYVSSDWGKCTFQVQDMILEGRELTAWMAKMPDRSWQVDLVLSDADMKCANRAERIVRSVGFEKIFFRRPVDAHYPSGLPPAD